MNPGWAYWPLTAFLWWTVCQNSSTPRPNHLMDCWKTMCSMVRSLAEWYIFTLQLLKLKPFMFHQPKSPTRGLKELHVAPEAQLAEPGSGSCNCSILETWTVLKWWEMRLNRHHETMDTSWTPSRYWPSYPNRRVSNTSKSSDIWTPSVLITPFVRVKTTLWPLSMDHCWLHNDTANTLYPIFPKHLGKCAKRIVLKIIQP